MLTADLQMIDPTQNPYLSGRLTPVHREIDSTEISVESDVPADLLGA